jgi:hypothetical protein
MGQAGQLGGHQVVPLDRSLYGTSWTTWRPSDDQVVPLDRSLRGTSRTTWRPSGSSARQAFAWAMQDNLEAIR